MNHFKTSALAAAVSAATLLAGATPSQAAFSGCGTSSATGSIVDFKAYLSLNSNQCKIGDKLYSGFNTAAWNNFPTDAQISLGESGALGITHTVTIQSASGFNGGASSTEYDFDYNITATGALKLDRWSPSAQSSLFDPVQNWALTTSATNPLLVDNRTQGSNPLAVYNFDPNTSTSLFNTTLVVQSGASGLNSWSQTVSQTPGPLPILGAGAAFGFSRKLRSRIKASA